MLNGGKSELKVKINSPDRGWDPLYKDGHCSKKKKKRKKKEKSNLSKKRGLSIRIRSILEKDPCGNIFGKVELRGDKALGSLSV